MNWVWLFTGFFTGVSLTAAFFTAVGFFVENPVAGYYIDPNYDLQELELN